MSGVVGRDDELSSIRAFVASVSEGAAALVLVGEAAPGRRRSGEPRVEPRTGSVLEARPVESETALSYAGLADLFEPSLAEALDELPPPSAGLSGSRLLEDVEGSPPDQRAVGAAVLEALQALSRRGPMLVGVDDVPGSTRPRARRSPTRVAACARSRSAFS